MRNWITLVEGMDGVTADETKFWYDARKDSFFDHDIDTHHVRVAVENPKELGLTSDEVAHHPHASGDYSDAGWDSEFDDDGSYDSEAAADNDDMGIFALLFDRGMVRGGHYVDLMSYHEYGDLRHDGGIYLQCGATRFAQKCVRACMKRWPDLGYFTIETDRNFVKLEGWEQIDQFMKFGRLS